METESSINEGTNTQMPVLNKDRPCFMEIQHFTTIYTDDKKLPRVMIGFYRHQWDGMNQSLDGEEDDYYRKLLTNINYIGHSELTYLDLYDFLNTPYSRDKKDFEVLEAVIKTHNSDALNRENEGKIKTAMKNFEEENPGNMLFMRVIIDYRGE